MTLCIHMPAMGPSSVRTMLLRGYAAFFSISVFSAIFKGNLLFVSAAVRQTPSSKPYYVLPNGVTVVCPGVAVGDTFDINDVTFTRVNSTTLQSLADADSAALSTSCTTGSGPGRASGPWRNYSHWYWWRPDHWDHDKRGPVFTD